MIAHMFGVEVVPNVHKTLLGVMHCNSSRHWFITQRSLRGQRLYIQDIQDNSSRIANNTNKLPKMSD